MTKRSTLPMQKTKKHQLQSAIVKRFQEAVRPVRHTKDVSPQEVRAFRILPTSTGLKFDRIPLRELDLRRELEDAERENTPALQAQIKEGFEAYMRGDVTPVEDFMAELEAELENG